MSRRVKLPKPAKDTEQTEQPGPNGEYRSRTVGELLEMLQGLPPNTQVILEGCDCWGDFWKVQHIRDNAILLLRTDTSS